MKAYYVYFIYLPLLFILSCQSDEESAKEYSKNREISYKITETISLTIPDTINYDASGFALHKNNLYLLNHKDNQNLIDVFSLEDIQHQRRISIDFEGNKGLGQIDDFFVQNNDSVFLFNSIRGEVSLIDSKGTLVNQWDFRKILENEENIEGVENFENAPFDAIYYKGNHLIIRIYSPYDFDKDATFYKYPIKLMYDIKTETYQTIGKYPSLFTHSSYFFSNDVDISYLPHHKSQQHIFSFRRDHHLYVFEENENKKIAQLACKSNFLPFDFSLIKREADFEEIKEHLLSQGAYRGLLYNPFRKEYYRIVDLPNEVAERKNGKVIRKNKYRKNSVILLDNELNVVGETLLKKDYEVYNAAIFPVPNGLMLMKVAETENLIEFDILTFDKS